MLANNVKLLVLLTFALLLGEKLALAQSATHRTEHFVVEAPSADVARKVAEVAEEQRKTQAKRWLGKDLPAWKEPCPIRVTIGNTDGGSSTFAFDTKRRKVLSQSMQVEGPLNQLLRSVIPHEVTHTVLASHFRKPIPRWVDEGIATLSEDESEQKRYDKMARQLVNEGRAIPLGKLFEMSQ